MGRLIKLLLLAFLTLAACGATHATVWTDEDISNAIHKRIAWNPSVSGNGVTVSTKDGIVILRGNVTNYLESRRAERIAASRRGVRSVVNKILVDPGSHDDVTLANAVKEALKDDLVFADQDIQVSARQGVVTLAGEVDYFDLKSLSETVAAPISGVLGLRNHVKVRPSNDFRPDVEIQSHVARLFGSDVWLNDFSISAGVLNGNVILSGSVGTLEQLNYAVQKAWVPGAISVDSSRLQVDPQVRDRSRRPRALPELDDLAIGDAIRDAFGLHSWVKSSNIDLDVSEGVATLRGTVSSHRAKRAARRTARNTVGVRQVDDRLTVGPSTPVEDSVVQDRVQRSLKRNFYTARYPLGVTVSSGTVTLSGKVETPFERGQAVAAAASAYGTREVVDRIRVNRLLRGYDPVPLGDSLDSTGYAQQETAHKSDEEIKDEIEDEFFWSWWVDRDAVTVSVKDGAATLSGEVESTREMEIAKKNAFEGGAHSVINKMHVKVR